jgi:hypothetical protein
MFQRFPTHDGYEDPQFSNFYGQTLPLVKRGVPVQTVHMENLAYPATLKDIKVLVMSYSNMKPVSAAAHKYIADWVQKGGVLVYCGRDDDPYQQVMEWWNTKGNHYKAPAEHLFELLHIQPGGYNQPFNVGKGKVYVIRQNPKEFVMQANSDAGYLDVLKSAWSADAKAGELVFKNNFYLQRGPYDMVSVMDESTSQDAWEINGPVIDLFDPQLPVLTKKTVQPGSQAFLYNIGRIENKKKPQVLAGACRIYNERQQDNMYSFVAKSPLNTRNSMRILLPAAPVKIMLTNSKGEKIDSVQNSWDTASRTCYLGFDNDPDGIQVMLSW